MESPRANPKDTQPKLNELLKSGATTEAEVLPKLELHPESAKERDDSNCADGACCALGGDAGRPRAAVVDGGDRR